jgi:peroxiredoxin
MTSTLINKNVKPFSATAFCDGDERVITDKDFRGHWSIVFFYPADFTFVCPTELSEMADMYEQFKSVGAEIYSVSTDTHYTHKAWHDSSDSIKKIKFPMVGDPTGIICRNFGVMIKEQGIALRGTFVVDPNGKIKAYEIHDLGIGRSAVEVLRKLQAAQFVAENGGEVCPAAWQPGKESLTPSLELVGKI